MHPNSSLTLLLILASLVLAACGNDQDPRLTAADVQFIKMQRLQQLYGGGTQTVTNTTINTVTITQTCAPPPIANQMACVQGLHMAWDTGTCRYRCL